MVFLHINHSNPNTKLLNDSIDKGKQIFVLFYLEGCGPCIAIRPEWKKMENVLMKYKKDPNVVIADVDQSYMKSIKHLKPITAFPTMRYMKGAFSEDYEKSRTIDSLVQWVLSKKQMTKTKSRKNNNERRTRHRNTRKNKSKKYRRII
jgi:hypothetical protein